MKLASGCGYLALLLTVVAGAAWAEDPDDDGRATDGPLFTYVKTVEREDGPVTVEGYVWPDGNVYSTSRPDDEDGRRTPIGRLGDANFPIPRDGGVIGRMGSYYVWSDGTYYSCARPSDDCPDRPAGRITLPLGAAKSAKATKGARNPARVLEKVKKEVNRLTGTVSPKTPKATNRRDSLRPESTVRSEGNVYSCARPGDDCPGPGEIPGEANTGTAR